jgi:hypothetical protein
MAMMFFWKKEVPILRLRGASQGVCRLPAVYSEKA